MNRQSPNSNRQSAIRVHIERLVVDASLLAAGQRDTLRTVVEAELSLLLRENGLQPGPSSVLHSLPARTIHIAKQSPPNRLGHQIAHEVCAALGPGGLAPITRQSDGGLG